MSYSGTIKLDTKPAESALKSVSDMLDTVQGKIAKIAQTEILLAFKTAPTIIDILESTERSMTALTGSTDVTNQALSSTGAILEGTTYSATTAKTGGRLFCLGY